MDKRDIGRSVSLRKFEANRYNAQLSTGPRTEAGKKHSRRNALKHGVLATALLIREGKGREDAAEFERLVRDLSEDLEPVAAMEEILVEKIGLLLATKTRLMLRGWTDQKVFCTQSTSSESNSSA